jgi:hypothetical protein
VEFHISDKVVQRQRYGKAQTAGRGSGSTRRAHDHLPELARDPELWKQGLNWFFKSGHQSSGLSATGLPTRGQADTGRTAWERRLIERLRLNHYSWRTEQTQLYTHVMKKPGLGVRSPLDALGG